MGIHNLIKHVTLLPLLHLLHSHSGDKASTFLITGIILCTNSLNSWHYFNNSVLSTYLVPLLYHKTHIMKTFIITVEFFKLLEELFFFEAPHDFRKAKINRHWILPGTLIAVNKYNEYNTIFSPRKIKVWKGGAMCHLFSAVSTVFPMQEKTLLYYSVLSFLAFTFLQVLRITFL